MYGRNTPGTAIEGEPSLLHRRVKRDLLHAVRSGKLQARLPSEEQLARDFGASRTTLRNALLELARDGIVVRRHGIGTFVVDGRRTVMNPLSRLQSLSSMIADSGFVPSVSAISVRARVRNPTAARALGRLDDARLTAIRRTFRADLKPAAVLTEFIPPSKALSEILATFDGNTLPLLDRLYGRVERAVATVTAVNAGRTVARELGISASAAVVRITQVAMSTAGQALAYTDGYLVPEVFTLSVVRQRE